MLEAEALPARALESDVHGGERCTCTSGAASGHSTASVPMVAQTARPPGVQLVAQSLSGAASQSMPSTGVHPAAMAPALHPPAPQ